MSATELEEIEGLVRHLQILIFNGVAALSFSLWDILITFDDEVAFIWPKNLRDPTKWLYLIVRYYSIAAQVALLSWLVQSGGGKLWSPRECMRWMLVEITCIPIIVSFAQALLVLRVCALYNGRRMRPLRIFLFAYWAIVVVVVFVTILTHFLTTFDGQLCSVAAAGSPLGDALAVFLISALSPLSLEVILLVLIARKFSVALREGWGRTPIMEVIMRDGIWAFVLTFVASVINLADSLSVTSLTGSTFSWSTAIFAFSAARMVLNTHRLAEPRGATAQLTTDFISQEASSYDSFDASSDVHPNAPGCAGKRPGSTYPLTLLPEQTA